MFAANYVQFRKDYCLQTTVLSEIFKLHTEYIVIIKKHFLHIFVENKVDWMKQNPHSLSF